MRRTASGAGIEKRHVWYNFAAVSPEAGSNERCDACRDAIPTVLLKVIE